ncbi:hypothetical protein TH66_00135 [Carbonactinospora thermoautotrophica]|uniref:Antitoxin n=1 Tax=Carbonactinospora thermoautotrophica TaxID=1469144 RepID=A0A132N3B4_9ACTN|nr:type II toxin-antitoxin system prevent-host-death family antitoxin [Carbonactinospora thermoautotrophica]KWX04638.1 hypothetical protein TR74_24260 [Carbonactinospora thermoautotrophica]KWX05962.1 hypothetical protein TH66_00135 [Carbonactinospora thermoautotrophica]
MASIQHEPVPVTQARTHLPELVNRAYYKGEITAIKRGSRGKPIAAVVPWALVELLEALEDRIDARDAEKVLARIKRGEEATVPADAVWKDLGL